MGSDIFHLAVNSARDWASTSSLGNLFPRLTTLIVKSFLLIANLTKLTLLHFKTVAPCPVTKNSPSILLGGPFR